MELKKVGKFIAKLRKENNLTQSELSEQLNVSVKTISRWETGTTPVDYSCLSKLSSILGVSEYDLLNGEKTTLQNQESQIVNFIDEKEKNIELKPKRNRILLFGFTLFVMIFLIVTTVLVFSNNYNNCHIYSIESEDNNYLVKGMIVNTPVQDYLVINLIENLTNFDLDGIELYAYEYSLYSNETVLYKNGNVSLYQHDKFDITIPLNEVIQQIKLYIEEEQNHSDVITALNTNKQMTLEILYLDHDLIKQQLIIPLKISKKYSNNKLY